MRSGDKKYHYIEAETREELFRLMDEIMIEDKASYNFSLPKFENGKYVSYFTGKRRDASSLSQKQKNQERDTLLKRMKLNVRN